MSPTGQILLWQLPESAQGCGWRPGSHRMFITPLCVEQSPLTCLLPTHPQASLCSCLCGSEALRVGWRCTRLSLQLLYPNASQRNAVERRASSSKHEDEWQWHSNHSTTLAAPYMFSLLSQLPFPICEAEHCLLSHMYLKRKKRKEKKRERQGN